MSIPILRALETLFKIICRNVIHNPLPRYHLWLSIDEIQIQTLQSTQIWSIPSVQSNLPSFVTGTFLFRKLCLRGLSNPPYFISHSQLVLHRASFFPLLLSLNFTSGCVLFSVQQFLDAVASRMWPIYYCLFCPFGP